MKTPIDWFVEATTRQQTENDYFELIDKANNMFKVAIIEAQECGFTDGCRYTTGYEQTLWETGDDYYKEKYEK